MQERHGDVDQPQLIVLEVQDVVAREEDEEMS
jgi:hypothetical protein